MADRAFCERERTDKNGQGAYGRTEPGTGAGRKKNTKEIDLVAKLFDEIAPKYADRNGGYTRIVKIGQRKGDGALEVLLELV